MKVWKTEIVLNRRGRNLPYDSARMHRILSSVFDSPGVLWSSPRPGVVLTQSDDPIPPNAFGKEVASIRSKQVNLLHPEGAPLEVAGIVSATRQESRKDGRGPRRPIAVEDFPVWIARQFSGAAVLYRVDVEQLSPAKGKRLTGEIVHTRFGFHAYATVTNGEKLADLLHKGVGRGKRFGCGMVTVRSMS